MTNPGHLDGDDLDDDDDDGDDDDDYSDDDDYKDYDDCIQHVNIAMANQDTQNLLLLSEKWSNHEKKHLDQDKFGRKKRGLSV